MTDPNKSPGLKLIYEGSVKRLWQCPGDPEALWFEFSDDYSIFDWGKMPDTIANKGRALTYMGAHFFKLFSDSAFWGSLKNSRHLRRFGGDWLKNRFNHDVYKRLEQSGLPHHFRRLTDGEKELAAAEVATAHSAYLEVIKARVPTPELKQSLNHELYFYPHLDDSPDKRASLTTAKDVYRRLIPLEVVFRFGMPQGSSLISRLDRNPEYLRDLGLPAVPAPGEWFPVPVIEFFTKLEPSDRLLSWTEAALLSGLSASSFNEMVELTLDLALGLYHVFAEKDLALWDGKFEFVVEHGRSSNILLADSIGPDELRLLYKGHHLSKELIRQIYKDSAWANALSRAKKLAKERIDASFKDICLHELNQAPDAMSRRERELVDKLYGSLANHIAGAEIFANQARLDELAGMIDEVIGGQSEKIDVLIVGSGGREHALTWKIAQSPLVGKVYCAPGNGGSACESKSQNVEIAVDNFEALSDFALNEKIGLVVIGPDNPLADGIVDYMQERGLKVFGPEQSAARLESSKAHAKEVMTRLGIPTARCAVFENKAQALKFARETQWARVVKVDGLALGKGVFVCDSLEEVESALNQIFEHGTFGSAGDKVVIEERLQGEELSIFLLCDGRNALIMAACQDHKRRFDNDEGPNTGGMGAYSPVPLYERVKASIDEQVIEPIRAALKEGALKYKGVLFIGLMIDDRSPYVLEFNARFGDPETQAFLPRLKSDLVPALLAVCDGSLDQVRLDWDERYSCCVVACAKNYPQSSSKGEAIAIASIDGASKDAAPGGAGMGNDIYIFHAGTKLSEDGKLTTNGGRVLAVTALASHADEAREKAYSALRSVSFDGMDYRKDIAWRIATKCHSR